MNDINYADMLAITARAAGIASEMDTSFDPLGNDADAFRLMLALDIKCETLAAGQWIKATGLGPGVIEKVSDHGDRPAAARRAIVRAAGLNRVWAERAARAPEKAWSAR